MHPRPHAIHVQAKHLILPHRYLPRVNIAAIVRASFPCSTPLCIRRRHRRSCRLLRCHQRSGDGVPQLKLLEEEHANHRSQREPFILRGVRARLQCKFLTVQHFTNLLPIRFRNPWMRLQLAIRN